MVDAADAQTWMALSYVVPARPIPAAHEGPEGPAPTVLHAVAEPHVPAPRFLTYQREVSWLSNSCHQSRIPRSGPELLSGGGKPAQGVPRSDTSLGPELSVILISWGADQV